MREDTPQPPATPVCGYRIERLLGTGGAAAVYEARRVGPRGEGERVACKILHTTKRNKALHRELARREAVLGLRVTAGHPNLVEVLDFFDDPQEQLCIVMELVDGTSVAELREPDRRLPFPVTRRIAVEVLEALACLHGRGVLHRDLSLGNILVTATGVVKVADFGGARLMEQGKVHTETIQATPMYAPREAIERLPLDVRSDLFALGAILYDLVAGVPPCGDETLTAQMIARNAAGNFAPLPPDTPADLDKLITGLIRPHRNERHPQTAAAALALLRGRGEPMASEEELAAMVAAVRARRGLEPEGDRPENELPPGHVLASRDADAPEDARPAVHRMSSRAADAVPDHLSDPLPHGVAHAVARRLVEAADGRADGAIPGHVAGRAPGRVTASMLGRASQDAGRRAPGVARALVARHAVLLAAVVACVLVLVSLLDDGIRPEQTAIEQTTIEKTAIEQTAIEKTAIEKTAIEKTAIEKTLPAEVPAPVVVPAQAPPVSPVVVTPVPAQESPPRAAEPTTGPRRKHTRTQRRNLRTVAGERRREHVPTVSEPPPWGKR